MYQSNRRLNIPSGHLTRLSSLGVTEEFDPYTYGVGNLNANLDSVLRVPVIERGVDKSWRRPTCAPKWRALRILKEKKRLLLCDNLDKKGRVFPCILDLFADLALE